MSVSKGTSGHGRKAEHSSFERVEFNWTADANGVASDTFELAGQVVETVTYADAGNGAYSVRLRDPVEAEIDYLNGLLVQACRSDVLEFQSDLAYVVAGEVEFHVSDAAAGSDGTFVAFLKTY